MKNMDYVLDVKNLSTSFISDRKEVRIVKNVSLRLRRGTTLAVVGESGCGKSVTVHSIVKLMPKNAKVTADQVLYRSAKDGKEYRLDQMEPFGVDMRKLRGAEIGMVFQDPMSSLNPVYKVGDQVAEGLIQHTGMSKAEARQRVLDMFRKLGIPDPESRISDYPHQFSGGMKQRVVIAIAMICNPDIIIADEPLLRSVPVLGLAEGQELGTIPGITPNPAELGPGCEFAGRCPFCQERCKEKDIPRFEVSPGHYVRCLKFDSFQEVD